MKKFSPIYLYLITIIKLGQVSSSNHPSIKADLPSHIYNEKTSSDNVLDSYQNQEAQERASLLVPKASSLHQTVVAFQEGKHV